MKRSRILTAALATGLAFVGGIALARSTQPDRKISQEEMQKMAEQMMALAQPGAEHESLGRMAGEWVTRSTFTMMPGQPAQSADGASSSRMILGGRFLEVRNSGEFMGQPFEGLTIVGYDRRHDRYTVVAYDNMGTYYVAAEGVKQPDGSLLLSGTTHDPKLNHTEKYDFVFHQKDADHILWEIWFHQPDGSRQRLVSSEFTRKK